MTRLGAALAAGAIMSAIAAGVAAAAAVELAQLAAGLAGDALTAAHLRRRSCPGAAGSWDGSRLR